MQRRYSPGWSTIGRNALMSPSRRAIPTSRYTGGAAHAPDGDNRAGGGPTSGDRGNTSGGEPKKRKTPAANGGAPPPAAGGASGEKKSTPPGRAERFDIARTNALFAFPWRGAALPSLTAWNGPAAGIEPSWWKEAGRIPTAAQPRLVEDDFTEFTSLNAAVRNQPPPDVVLNLIGQGPYRLVPDDWSRLRSVAIRAAGELKDVVLDLSQVRDGEAVRLGRCSLVLENIRLWIIPPQGNAPEAAFCGVFSSFGSDVAFVHCVVEPLETLAQPLVLCKMNAPPRGVGGPGSSPKDRLPAGRVLFERCALWCPRLSVLAVRSCSVALAAHRSLLCVPDATAVSAVTDDGAGAAAFDLRIAHCSVLVGRKLCAFDVETPPRGLSIGTAASILATTDPQGEVISAANWPVNQIIEGGRARLRQATWFAEQTVLVGWKRLLTTSPFVTASTPSPESWQTIWGMPAGVRFVDVRDPIQWLGPLPVAEWTVATKLQRLAGDSAGCTFTDLPVVDGKGLVRVQAYRRRPVLGSSRFGPGSPRIEVDLANTPLEEALGRPAWTDGTVFVIRGSGRHRVRPIVIDGRSVRIEFESTRPDDPLVLQPSPARRARTDSDAMLTVRNADIEIQGATVEFPPAFRADGTPARWLAVDGGAFRVEGCRVYGPTADGVGFDALIQWTRPESEPAAPQSRRRGAILDSYLIGRCPLVNAQLRGRELLIHNALLVSDETAVVIDIRGLSAEIDAAIDVAQSTFSAARAFEVKSVRLAERARRPCRLGVIRSVFAPPPADVASGLACVLSAPPEALEHEQLRWFGDTNAFGRSLVPLCGADSTESSGDPLAAWTQRWGKQAVLDPVFGEEAVRWAAAPRMKTRPGAEGFLLDGQCTAATAGVGGRPLGCDPRRWPRPVVREPEGVTRR